MREPLDLGRLPRVAARAGFTEDVLRRVRTRGPRSPSARPRLVVAAIAVVVVSTAAGAWWARQSAPSAEPLPMTAESIKQLRSEVRELNRELESLHRLAEDTQPFVPVSVNPRTEVLLDLRDIEPLAVGHAAAVGRRTH